MIKAYSQRLTPPYSGQAQIVETERARAVSMDGEIWEIHFIFEGHGGTSPSAQGDNRRFRRIAYIRGSEIADYNANPERNGVEPDERILELTVFLETATLPFAAADRWEYWLMDPADNEPLAMIFSCNEGAQMETFPRRLEWNALPAAILPVEPTEPERQRCDSPVNYRLERLIEARAGRRPQARWFQRRPAEEGVFPPLMIREDWDDEADSEICRRYLHRQSTRLLMLHGLDSGDRRRLEEAARPHAMEVLRFHTLYPEFANNELMNTILVEARMRASLGEDADGMARRDGVLYL
ncbi:MAG: hypothetical protein ACPGU7_11745 [Gammaproteobacteria bacterium]